MPSHLSAAQAPEDLWRCRECGWTYPNHHPSAKHRRNHKKQCGKLPGFPSLIAGAGTPEKSPSPSPSLVAGNESSHDVSSDDEHHLSVDREAPAGERFGQVQEVSSAAPSPVSAVPPAVERDSPAGTPPASTSPQVSIDRNHESRSLPRSPDLLAVPDERGIKSPAQSAHEVEGKWVCRQCGWTYPNSHPSAKHRRKHKQKCEARAHAGGLGGSSDDGSSDEEHHHEIRENGLNLPNGQSAPPLDLTESPPSESNVFPAEAEVNEDALTKVAGKEQPELVDVSPEQIQVEKKPSLEEQSLDRFLGSAAPESRTDNQVGGIESEEVSQRELPTDTDALVSLLTKANSEKESSATKLAPHAAVSELSQITQVANSGSISSAKEVGDVATPAATGQHGDSATSNESAQADKLTNLEVPVIDVESIHDPDDIQKKLEAFPESIPEPTTAAWEAPRNDQIQQTDDVNDLEIADGASSAVSVDEESTGTNIAEDPVQRRSLELEINELQEASPVMEQDVPAVSKLAENTEQQEPSSSDFDTLGEKSPPAEDQVTALFPSLGETTDTSRDFPIESASSAVPKNENSLAATAEDPAVQQRLNESDEGNSEETVTPTVEDAVQQGPTELDEGILEETVTPAAEDAVQQGPEEVDEAILGQSVTPAAEDAVQQGPKESDGGILEETVTPTAEDAVRQGPKELDKGILEETIRPAAEDAVQQGLKDKNEGILEKTVKPTAEDAVQQGPKELDEGNSEETVTAKADGGAPPSQSLGDTLLARNPETENEATDALPAGKKSNAGNALEHTEQQGSSASDEGELKESALPVEDGRRPMHSQSVGDTAEGKVPDESKLDETNIPPLENGRAASISEPLGMTILLSDPQPNKVGRAPASIIKKPTTLRGLEDLKQEGASAILRKDRLREKQNPAENNTTDLSAKLTLQTRRTPSKETDAATGNSNSSVSGAGNMHVETTRRQAPVPQGPVQQETAIAQESPGTVRSRIEAYEKMVGSIDLQQYRRKSFSPRTPGVEQYQSPRIPGVQQYQSPKTPGIQQYQSPRTPAAQHQQQPLGKSAEKSSTEKNLHEFPEDIRNTISHLRHQYPSEKPTPSPSPSPSERESELFQAMNHLRRRDEVF